MTPVELHPEHLIETERLGTLSAADRRLLHDHRARCAACQLDKQLSDGFAEALAPGPSERASAAAIVARLFEADPRGQVVRLQPGPRAEPRRSTGAGVGAGADAHPDTASGLARPRSLAAIATSLALHAAILLLIVRLPLLDVPPPATSDAVEVELVELLERARPGATAALPAPPRPAEALGGGAQVPVRRGARPVARRAASNPTPTGATATAATPTAGVEPTSEEPEVAPRLSPRALTLLLDPRNVALGGWTIEGQPSHVGPPAGLGDGPGNTIDEAALEAALSGGLREEAMARAHITRVRPELRRRADGSHLYEGHRFSAIIQPDGSVVFEDQPGIATNGFSASGTFDLTEALMQAAGQDPHRAEREWFMQHTEELRHRLEDQHRGQTMRAALRGLRGRLVRIWATSARSRESRRARIFEIWDDMADDATGEEARAIVLRFVRETLPMGSEDAYPEAELDRLNRRRASEERFAPYR